MRCRVVGRGGYKYEDGILLQGSCTDTARVGGARAHGTVRTGSARAHAAAVWREAGSRDPCTCRQGSMVSAVCVRDRLIVCCCFVCVGLCFCSRCFGSGSRVCRVSSVLSEVEIWGHAGVACVLCPLRSGS